MSGTEKVERTLTGRVSRPPQAKTITIIIDRYVKHSEYGKYLRRQTKIHAHDEAGEGRLGDLVKIAQCRPVSKTKAWRLVEVVQRAPEAE
jgi:small subunit ribosomal protein S17